MLIHYFDFCHKFTKDIELDFKFKDLNELKKFGINKQEVLKSIEKDNERFNYD